MTQPSSGRARALGIALGLVVALAAGCGGDDALDQTQLKEALLTTENLGTGWVQQPTSEDGKTGGSDATATGCLSSADDISALDAVEKTSASFAYTQGSMTVANGVGTYGDQEKVSGQFETAYHELKDCTTISSKSQAGSFKADITTDQAKSHGDVDNQLNVSANGQYEVQGQSQPFNVMITVAQIGRNLTTVQTINTDDATELHRSYVEIAIARLAAVADGETPEGTVAPAPGAS